MHNSITAGITALITGGLFIGCEILPSALTMHDSSDDVLGHCPGLGGFSLPPSSEIYTTSLPDSRPFLNSSSHGSIFHMVRTHIGIMTGYMTNDHSTGPNVIGGGRDTGP